MSKKILSVMLALVMVLSVFSIVSFAGVNTQYEVETYDPDLEAEIIAYTQKWSLVTDNTPVDGMYTVDVVLETNYGVGPISIVIDAVGATLTNAVAGAALANEDLGFNPDVQIKEDNTVVYIIPDPADEGTEAPVLAAGSVIATLTFELTEASATVSLINDAKNFGYAGNLIAARPEDGTLACSTLFYGQRILDKEGNDIELDIGAALATVNLGEEVAAEPVLKGIDTGVVDTERSYVYGVPKDTADLTKYFEVENGSFEMVANAGGYTNGTGSTLVVKNLAGEETARYTLIIFGDVNGDGSVTASDYATVLNKVLGGKIDTEAGEFAADIILDGGVTASDYATILNHVLGGEITINPYAA